MTARRPKDLVLTLFGDYLLHRSDSVWVGSLVALLAPFGVSEGAVRTVLSRMTTAGWLTSRKVGRRSYYALTEKGRGLFEAGEERIYHPAWERKWNGRWFLLTYTIPESDRHLRDRLRDRLAWMGFGSLGNGLWVSPHSVEEEVREVAVSLGIEDRIECFTAEATSFTTPQKLVERCWNLPALNLRYEAFIQKYSGDFLKLREGSQTGGLDPEASFKLRFELTHEYREFPFIDPFLPRSLVPRNWAGECAAHLFRGFHDLLQGPADAYVDGLLEAGPLTSAKSTTSQKKQPSKRSSKRA